MHGFLNINKPYGITSFSVVKAIKKVLNKKTAIGHLGTLDPMATGVLPLAIGSATKLIPFIPNNRKSYRAIMTLGGISDTQDAQGQIVYNEQAVFKPEKLPAILDQYTGEIEQIPPMYSAVHYKGQRLYRLARRGEVVDRAPRKTLIYELQLLDILNDAAGRIQLALQVVCSSGTYIRTLCHDIGDALGTGAYLSSLERVSWGDFEIKDSVSLTSVIKDWQQYLYALDYPLQALPSIYIYDPQQITAISHGNAVSIDYPQEHPTVKIYNRQPQLVAIAKTIKNVDEAMLIQPIRVFNQLIG